MADETSATDKNGGFTGSCLCGAVHYESAVGPVLVGQCHCEACRKSSGTDHSTNLFVPDDAFTLTGTLKYFDTTADSGNIVSQGFCPDCGASVLMRNSMMPDKVFIKASSLDDLEIARPQMVVFASRAPSWRHLDPDVPTFPEMPTRMPKEVV
ncbi:aldehyde-activating protein [Methyloceanibacter stevinii]|uniref:Aldehyde-activating protein n=1 Tax=Methyloceanibacter stevinii TaxID=1774970 RepID=A0A1E3VUR3_9HYPH|nr:GFA family protein [Methyloceanibacter stevinii]ODR97249.1 aldehyde-activating protein [Methyloceanibacter stevinii]